MPLVLACFSMAAVAADRIEAAQRPITHDVYDGCRSIQDMKLSDDGVWVVYTLAPQDGDSHVVARNLTTGVEYRHPRGKEPLITVDTRFVLFTIAPANAEVDRARMDKTKKEEQPTMSNANPQQTDFRWGRAEARVDGKRCSVFDPGRWPPFI